MTLDPVTLAVIQNGLRQVASEMDLVHEKTSFSPVISEGFDRSNGIYDRTTGEVVAQATAWASWRMRSWVQSRYRRWALGMCSGIVSADADAGCGDGWRPVCRDERSRL